MKMPPLRRIPSALLFRRIRPVVWKYVLEGRLRSLSDDDFFRSMGWQGQSFDLVDSVHSSNRHRFFFHPRNRKDFFLNLLTTAQPYDSILEEAEHTVGNRFQTLGSDLVSLGDSIHWQQDFKSGKEWELKPSGELDFLDLKNPSDVKIPWELSRFHQVWWLGKAYWLTGNNQYAEKFRSLIEDWIENNPVGRGVNWAIAMEAAIRSCNWIAGYYFFCESPVIPREFWVKFLRSLLTHGRFIESHLEYSCVNGNHFLSNVIGLIFLGVFFREIPIGKRWLRWGVDRLHTEMEYEVYDDGVNHEKSIGYHRLVLEFFVTAAILCEHNKIPLTIEFRTRLERMFEFVQHYSRPDGSVPNVGDADDGRLFRMSMSQAINDHRHLLSVGAIFFNRADLKSAAGRFDQESLWYFGGEGFERHQLLGGESIPLQSRTFSSGGFHILRSHNAHLFVDTGDLGLRGLGGHGHNDTLSFELWIAGVPVIVDSGTYVYTSDPEARQQFRSIHAHNTICVDDEEPAPFRSLWSIEADNTNPRVLKEVFSEDSDILAAEYQCAPGILHRRSISLSKRDFRVELADTISGSGTHTIVGSLHFHPSCFISLANTSSALIRCPSGLLTIRSSAGSMSLHDAYYSPSYGVRISNLELRVSLKSQLPSTISLEFHFDPAALS